MPYIMKKLGNERVSPGQFGYWSVRWAFDAAKGLVVDLLQEHGQPGSLKRRSERTPFRQKSNTWHLLGLHTGFVPPYWPMLLRT